MPFFDKKQREEVKRFLDDVLSDADVKDQFNKAQKREQGPVSDYTGAMLRQYMGMLKEIADERAKPMAPPDAVSPDLETLKKKYFGPKR